MLLAFAVLLTATVVAAEPTTSSAGSHGAVSGTVALTDARGERFDAAGAELALACGTTPDEAKTAAADEHGVFDFADVKPGRCVLTADLQGFATATTEVAVRNGETVKVAIHLKASPVESGVRAVAAGTCSWHKRRFN
jgi:Carboxypeptidase regulatory-like domain